MTDFEKGRAAGVEMCANYVESIDGECRAGGLAAELRARGEYPPGFCVLPVAVVEQVKVALRRAAKNLPCGAEGSSGHEVDAALAALEKAGAT